MKRKMLWRATLALALTLALPSAGSAGSSPDPVEVEWGPAVPCVFWCAYWSMPGAVGYRACDNPFPAGSYADVVTEPAPDLGDPTMLVVAMDNEVDWDLFVCLRLSNGSNNGPMVGRGVYGPQGCKGQTPDLPGLGPIQYGCDEIAQVPVTPGARYVLRAYNWSDPLPAHGTYRFIAA